MGRRKVQVDSRVQKLSDASVLCRTLGHARDILPQGRARRAELAPQGQREQILRCSRCSWTQPLLIDSATGDVIGAGSGKYPDGYLLPRGSGRLPRSEARKELFARLGV